MNVLGARAALVVATLAAGGAGWFGAQQFGEDESASVVAIAAVDFYGCGVTDPATATSALSLGQVHAGDRLWLLGVSDDRWAVVRRPDHPDQPVWLPLAMVATTADSSDLPQLTCATADATATTAAATTFTAAPAAPITVPAEADPSSTLGLDTTTSSSTSTTTTSTLPTDVTPPTVTVTADRAYLYVVSNRAPCSDEDSLEVTIVVADSSVPLTIRSIVATWSAPAGPQTANLVPVAGNRFSLQIPANGPAGGETPLTLTATGADGVGNVGTGQVVVSLRDPGSFGCTG